MSEGARNGRGGSRELSPNSFPSASISRSSGLDLLSNSPPATSDATELLALAPSADLENSELGYRASLTVTLNSIWISQPVMHIHLPSGVLVPWAWEDLPTWIVSKSHSV